MKIYTDNIGEVQLIDSMGDDLAVVNAARNSYGAYKDALEAKDERLIRRLVKDSHWSPFEHCFVKFWIVAPIPISKQHMRHRSWSFSEISRRFTSSNIEIYVPEGFRTQHKTNHQGSNLDSINPMLTIGTLTATAVEHYRKSCTDSIEVYDSLLEAGVCREQARFVLPQALYTNFTASCSLRSLLHFIDLRSASDAQWEIQKVSDAMLSLVEDQFPLCIKFFKEKNDGLL